MPLADALGVLVGMIEGVEPRLDDRERRDDRVDPQAGHELELVHDPHLLGGDERDVEDVVPHRHGAEQPHRRRASRGAGSPTSLSIAPASTLPSITGRNRSSA